MNESKLMFFKNEFEAKVCIADMLCEVTFAQAEALRIALEKWDELDKRLSGIEGGQNG